VRGLREQVVCSVTCCVRLQTPFIRYWDLFTVTLLMYTATVTPVEVAFLSTKLDGLFILNRIIDCAFLVVRCARQDRSEQQAHSAPPVCDAAGPHIELLHRDVR
jgi:hypothetical protein